MNGPSPRSVCLYTPSRDASGMGAHMIDLATEYVRDGMHVTFLAWPTESGQRLLQRAAGVGARPFALPHPRHPDFADAIVDILDAHPPEVFHVHVGTGLENFDGARAARRAGVPAVVQTQHLPWRLRPHKAIRLLRSLREVDRIIAVSDGLRRTYEAVGVPEELLTTVPNGIRARGPGPGRAAARSSLGLSEDQQVVMTVGRLLVMKGQRYLVDAVPRLLERFPRLAVVLVGQGPLHRALAEQARALGVDSVVHLAGHRPDARMLLDAADVFVLPSRHEGMPLAALEAMDAGLPVVATRVIGSAEVVDDGRTGLLVPPEDPDALAEALAALLADGGMRARYGEAGLCRYRQGFTSARMAADTRAVYEHVLSRVSSPAVA